MKQSESVKTLLEALAKAQSKFSTLPKDKKGYGYKYAEDMPTSYHSVSAFDVQDNGKLVFVEYMDTDENPRSMLLIDDHWLIIAAQKGGTLETFELKRNESKGVLYETHYNYMIGEPICMIEGKEY